MYFAETLRLEQSVLGHRETTFANVAHRQLLDWAKAKTPGNVALFAWQTHIAFLHIDRSIYSAHTDTFLQELVMAFGYRVSVLENAAGVMCKTGRIHSVLHNPRGPNRLIRSYQCTFHDSGVIWMWDPSKRCTKGLIYTQQKLTQTDLPLNQAVRALATLKRYKHLRTNPMLLGLVRLEAEIYRLESRLASSGTSLAAIHVKTRLHNYTGFDQIMDVENVNLADLSADASTTAMDISTAITRLQAIQPSLDFVIDECRSLEAREFVSLPTDALLRMVLASTSSISPLTLSLKRSAGLDIDEGQRQQWNSEILVQTVFTLTNQKDQELSIQIARDSKTLAEQTTKDSTSMKAIAAVTMFFLPGTFIAVSLTTSCNRNHLLTKTGCTRNAHVLIPRQSRRPSEQQLLALLGNNTTAHVQCGLHLASLGQSTRLAAIPGKDENQKSEAKGL